MSRRSPKGSADIEMSWKQDGEDRHMKYRIQGGGIENGGSTGKVSDGYHTFDELYRYRALYHAGFVNAERNFGQHKSRKHSDGKFCFDAEGEWFIVIMNLPTGQISNHYHADYWDLFNCEEREVADEWDGHTPQEAADRLEKYLRGDY